MKKKDLTEADAQTALGLIPEVRICAQCKHCATYRSVPFCRRSPRDFKVDPVSGDTQYRQDDGKYWAGESIDNRYHNCYDVNRDGKCSMWEAEEPTRIHLWAIAACSAVAALIWIATVYFK